MATTTGVEPAYSPELLRSVEAPQAAVFDCIMLLVPTAGSVALQFRLCQRILQFPLDQVAFWLPELVHVFVTCETESAALEDALLTLSQRSTHVALSVFWFLQSSLHDLKHDPHAPGFVSARRLTNRMQPLLFSSGELTVDPLMHENPQPALTLAAMVAASIAMPRLGKHMKPLVESQGRKQRSAYLIRRVVQKLSPHRSNSNSMAPTMGDAEMHDERRTSLSPQHALGAHRTPHRSSESRESSEPPDAAELSAQISRQSLSDASETSPKNAGHHQNKHSTHSTHHHHHHHHNNNSYNSQHGVHGSHHRTASTHHASSGSQPNLLMQHGSLSTDSLNISTNHSMPNLSSSPHDAQANQLKTNYFRCETQFVYALNAISLRLLQVPKEARQSALQVELALLNEDLPHAEVDLPMLLPQRYGKQNRIVRICVSEATVLNSAEKAPFLLLIEYLRGDLTFDPQKPRNREILRSDPKLRTHIFERPALTQQSSSVPVPDAADPSAAGAGTQSKSSSRRASAVAGSGAGTLAGGSTTGSTTGSTAGTAASTEGAKANGSPRKPSAGASHASSINGSRRSSRRSTVVEEYEMDISEVSILEREESATNASPLHHSHKHAKQHSPHGQFPMSETEASAAALVHEQAQFAEGPSAADLATQWRTASLILAQLDGSTNLPRQDVQAIRQRIIKSMQDMQRSPQETARSEAGERRLENDLKTSGMAVHEDSLAQHAAIDGGATKSMQEDDPSAANLGEDWEARRARIRKTSKHGHHANWDLVSVIVKTGDDLRQEALASQLIQRAMQIWKSNGVGVWARRMMILITSANSGLVETITNALSLHSIKKALTTAQVNEGGDPRTIAQLTQHFEHKFGNPAGARYQKAVRNFVESLAAYSILCYVLQIKDRHNGNILVDAEGHIIHIDFGFMLSNSPGHIGFEANTFKLTQEYVNLMGGTESEHWALFMELVVQAFLALRQHTEEFVSFMVIMGTNSTLPCFSGGAQNTAQALRQRMMPDLNEDETRQAVERMVWKSYGSYYTRLYDQYQMATQGIYN